MHKFSQVTLCGVLVGSCVIANAASAQGQYSSLQLPSSGADSRGGHDTTVSRTDSALLGVRVSLNASERTVEQALLAVLKQAKLRVVYNSEQAAFARKFNRRIDDLPVMEAVSLILKGTGLTAKIAPGGEAMLIRAESQNAQEVQQTGMIRGRITDSATGRELVGVTVVVRGTRLSATTNERGQYAIPNVPLGPHILDIRMLGFRSLTRTVQIEEGKRLQLNVVMSATATALSEVVTSVTGTQQKIKIGNDVTTINVDSVIRTAPITSVTDLLETRVPGLTVMRSSGGPGAPSRIRLRGVGGGLLANQIGGATNDPIVIVDGIRIYASQSSPTDQNLAPGSNGAVGGVQNFSDKFPPPSAIDQIDVNSIEKIEVFKGPSASALYGSDAANGVIVITTKRGQPGSTRWSLSASQGIEYMPGFYAEPGYYPFGHPVTGSFDASTICRLRDPCIVDSVVRFQALNVDRLSTIGRGSSQTASASVSGGSQAVTYSITGSVSNTMGLVKMPPLLQDLYKAVYDSGPARWMIRPNRYQSWGMNTSIIAEPRRGLRTTLVFSLSNSVQQQSSANLQLSTLASAYIDTTNLGPETVGAYATRVTSEATVSNISLATNWDAWRNLPLTTTIGINTNNRQDTRFVPYGIMNGTGFQTAPDRMLRDTMGFYSAGHGTNLTKTGRLIGTLFPTWRVATAMGFEITETQRNDFQGSIDTLAPGITVPSRFRQAGLRSAATSTGGWFVEPRLNINSRFFVNPGFRLDGNSASGSRGGVNGGFWSLFPKLNFSWIALDRQGMEPLFGIFSLIRPRLAFGYAGTQPASTWKLRLVKRGSSQVPGTSVETSFDPGLVLTSLGNTELHPERTREIEGGVDAQLWGNRLEVSATLSNKLRLDAIEQLQVAPSIYGGKLSYYVNIGKVRNSNIEFQLKALIIDRPLMSWTVNASLSKNKNVLVALNSDKPYIDMGDGTRLVPGYPLFGRWELPILGFSDPGDRRLTGNEILIGESAVYMGQQIPNFELPVSTSLSLFKGQVSVNAAFQYKDGLTQFNSGSEALLTNRYFNPNASLAEQAAAIAATCGGLGATFGVRRCTKYGLIQTVNILRFSSFSIGYNVPRSYTQRVFRVPSVTIALQGSNLGFLTNYRGKDPDVNSMTVGDATIDSGQLPQPRTWRLQVRLGN